jgi:hypothetical protein
MKPSEDGRMESYIESLRKHVETHIEERELAKQQEALSRQTMQSLTKPLEQQLIELLRTLSPDQLYRHWTMEDFVMRLKGRFRDRPHPQKVGEALRKLGWQRRRVYGAQGDGKRYWFPPAVNN